jgi:hypothetical protein
MEARLGVSFRSFLTRFRDASFKESSRVGNPFSNAQVARDAEDDDILIMASNAAVAGDEFMVWFNAKDAGDKLSWSSPGKLLNAMVAGDEEDACAFNSSSRAEDALKFANGCNREREAEADSGFKVLPSAKDAGDRLGLDGRPCSAAIAFKFTNGLSWPRDLDSCMVMLTSFF